MVKPADTTRPSVARELPWGIYSFLREPDGRMRLPSASAGLTQLFGVDLEVVREDAGQIFARVVPEDLASLLTAIEVSATRLSVFFEEFRILGPEGRIRWVEARTLPPTRTPEGAILWHGVCQDVTDRHTARSQLRITERSIKY